MILFENKIILFLFKNLPSPQGELFPVSSSSIFTMDVSVGWSPALFSELFDTRGCHGSDFLLSIEVPKKIKRIGYFSFV